MRAIVHSVHSQVPLTLSRIGLRPETILSLDSHLDVSLGGDLDLYPGRLRVMAQRTGVHAAFRNITGGLAGLSKPRSGPRLVVAIPQMMFERHAAEAERQLPRALRLADEGAYVSSWMNFLRRTMGVELYESPPRPLAGLARRVKGKRWVLDIDVDYIHEMQRECYTRIINPGPGVLQSMSAVVEFIERSRPETVTISEVKVSAVKRPGSAYSGLRKALAEAGYEFDESALLGSDEEVAREISVCKEFYRTVSRRLAVAHMEGMARGDTSGFEEEEKEAARRFFRSKGYGPPRARP